MDKRKKRDPIETAIKAALRPGEFIGYAEAHRFLSELSATKDRIDASSGRRFSVIDAQHLLLGPTDNFRAAGALVSIRFARLRADCLGGRLPTSTRSGRADVRRQRDAHTGSLGRGA